MKNKIICEIEGVKIVQEKPTIEVDWRALSVIGIHATKKQVKKIKKLVKRGKIRKAQRLVLKIIDDWELPRYDFGGESEKGFINRERCVIPPMKIKP